MVPARESGFVFRNHPLALYFLTKVPRTLPTSILSSSSLLLLFQSLASLYSERWYYVVQCKSTVPVLKYSSQRNIYVNSYRNTLRSKLPTYCALSKYSNTNAIIYQAACLSPICLCFAIMVMLPGTENGTLFCRWHFNINTVLVRDIIIILISEIWDSMCHW